MSIFHISMQILRGTTLFSGKIFTARKNFTRPPVATNFKSAPEWAGGKVKYLIWTKSHKVNFALFQLSEDHEGKVFSNWVGQYLVLLFKSAIPHACLKETGYTVIKRENLSRWSRRWWMNSAKMSPTRNVIRYSFSL